MGKGRRCRINPPNGGKYVTGNPKIEDTHGKVVLTRGPWVYCLEEADNTAYFDENNQSLLLPEGFKAEFHKNPMGGVVTLNGRASLHTAEDEIDITAISYYAWSNRGQGQMKVWLPLVKK